MNERTHEHDLTDGLAGKVLAGSSKLHIEAVRLSVDKYLEAGDSGEAAELFERLLGPHIPVKNCGKLDDAVRSAAADSEAGDTVLLSPACASFDQFRDFEDRGDQFRDLVGAL